MSANAGGARRSQPRQAVLQDRLPLASWTGAVGVVFLGVVTQRQRRFPVWQQGLLLVVFVGPLPAPRGALGPPAVPASPPRNSTCSSSWRHRLTPAKQPCSSATRNSTFAGYVVVCVLLCFFFYRLHDQNVLMLGVFHFALLLVFFLIRSLIY